MFLKVVILLNILYVPGYVFYNGYSHLILTEILWGKFSHYHHFTERKWSLMRDELLLKLISRKQRTEMRF